MTISIANPSDYSLSYFMGGADSYTVGGSAMSLSTYGFRLTGLGANMNYGEIKQPLSDGVYPLSDGTLSADTMTFVGGMHATDPDDLLTSFHFVFNRLRQAPSKNGYIDVGFDNGGGQIHYRRYVMFNDGNIPYASGTRHYAFMGATLSFRAYDPGWYLNIGLSESITITSGTGNVVTVNTGIRGSRRCVIRITKTGGTTPTNPTVTNAAGQSFTITDTLATLNDYWEVDCYHGTCVKSVSAVVSDNIAKFTGQFLTIAASADLITVTDGGTATYSATCKYLPRLM